MPALLLSLRSEPNNVDDSYVSPYACAGANGKGRDGGVTTASTLSNPHKENTIHPGAAGCKPLDRKGSVLKAARHSGADGQRKSSDGLRTPSVRATRVLHRPINHRRCQCKLRHNARTLGNVGKHDRRTTSKSNKCASCKQCRRRLTYVH